MNRKIQKYYMNQGYICHVLPLLALPFRGHDHQVMVVKPLLCRSRLVGHLLTVVLLSLLMAALGTLLLSIEMRTTFSQAIAHTVPSAPSLLSIQGSGAGSVTHLSEGAVSGNAHSSLTSLSLLWLPTHATVVNGQGKARVFAHDQVPHDGPCLNLLDANCWTQLAQFTSAGIAKWVAQGIVSLIEPTLTDITNWISTNPDNIVTATPAALTSENATVQTLFAWSVGIVDVALLLGIIVAGYSIMANGVAYYENMRTLPALALAAVAANFALSFVAAFIDFNNQLCAAIVHLVQITVLTDLLQSLFSGSLLQTNLLAYVLGILFAILLLLLGFQMCVRIAWFDVQLVFLPWMLLFCGSAATQHLGRAGLLSFFTTLYVQAVQVMALGLGGMLISAISAGLPASIDPVIQFVVGIAVLYLVLRLPTMLGSGSVRAMADASRSVVSSYSQAYMQAGRAALTLL